MFNMTSAMVMMGVTLGAALWIYEKKEIVVEKVVLIALLSALASVGRILFAAIPSVQPASFVIIVTGMCFGREMGMMTGIVTAFASNLVLGQGPWTPWQMFLWGMMGLMAGALSKPLQNRKWIRAVYGIAAGFVFGWVMNIWYIAGYGEEVSMKVFWLAAASSFYLDFAHGITNAVLLTAVGDRLMRTFNRIILKYKL